jgi:hypothetical protein
MKCCFTLKKIYIVLAFGTFRKSGGTCRNHINFKNITQAEVKLSARCLVWKISKTPLLVVDKGNHLSKQFLPLFYK